MNSPSSSNRAAQGTTALLPPSAELSGPLSWQDIRLCAGEGKLSPESILAAANILWGRRLERAAQPSPAWQPIESAPRDGTVVDLWLDSGRRVADARWGEPSIDADSEYGEYGWVTPDGEYARGEDEWPTHFMPLGGSEMSPSEVLSKAADLIEPEGAWLQGCLARTIVGEPVRITDPSAVCFCALGALIHAAGDTSNRAYREAKERLERRMPTGSIVAFNNAPERTQAEVVAALRAASELAKGEGQ